MLDITTGQTVPVAGATILFTYRGSTSMLVDSRDSCWGASLGVSDSLGRFQMLPETGPALTQVYKPGLVYADQESTYNRAERTINLRVPKTQAELVSQLGWVKYGSLCKSADVDGLHAIAKFIEAALQDVARMPADGGFREIREDLQRMHDRMGRLK